MNAKSFVDTNVLVYAHDKATGAKHDRARELVEQIWLSGNGAISTQVLQEFCVAVRRKPPHSPSLEDIDRVAREYLAWDVVVNTPVSVLEALALGKRFKVSFWDALILVAAGHSRAATLYSEDFSHGQTYGEITVINPFLV